MRGVAGCFCGFAIGMGLPNILLIVGAEPDAKMFVRLAIAGIAALLAIAYAVLSLSRARGEEPTE